MCLEYSHSHFIRLHFKGKYCTYSFFPFIHVVRSYLPTYIVSLPLVYHTSKMNKWIVLLYLLGKDVPFPHWYCYFYMDIMVYLLLSPLFSSLRSSIVTPPYEVYYAACLICDPWHCCHISVQWKFISSIWPITVCLNL